MKKPTRHSDGLRQVVVGVFCIGAEEVQVVLRSGTGGEFWFIPEEGKIARIKIGADSAWESVVASLLHEALEMQMARHHCRFDPSPDFGRDHSSYLFVMNHPQFSDIVARVGMFTSACLPEVGRAYRKWRKTQC